MGLFRRSTSSSTTVVITGNGQQVNLGQVDGQGIPLTEPTKPSRPTRGGKVTRDDRGNQVNTGTITGGMHN
ncbi:hypothetical protein ABH931_000142 [Streptacidiphilus sp. MAP12-33]|uniref:hypothetical protein n=1 Tax=Streptacidiphilus sp. MAP12-33 TaxID=3156266 RepID=UPI0035146912